MPRNSFVRCLSAASVALCLLVASQFACGQEPENGEPDNGAQEFRTEPIRGQVVWLADALKSQFGISTVPEAEKSVLAILTKDGRLVPIVENLRGRAFRKDERLRGKEMEILARRYERQPLIQVLRIYELDDGERYEIDYWCDVCAIVMYEKGPCSCCQDDNRLRRRRVEEEVAEQP